MMMIIIEVRKLHYTQTQPEYLETQPVEMMSEITVLNDKRFA